ncbi:hypothetical protein ACFS07_15085 [Undibacterium arcticum]
MVYEGIKKPLQRLRLIDTPSSEITMRSIRNVNLSGTARTLFRTFFQKNVIPSGYPNFDSRNQALRCFFNQLTLFKAIAERIDSVVANIEGELYAELQDSEIVIARQLAKVRLRAAGALMGVVIEGHLQKVASSHGVTVGKKNPTNADLNDPLKSASVIDIPAWRKISFLADLRNLCSHKKDAEPTKEQVEEFIQGAEWLTKNVF